MMKMQKKFKFVNVEEDTEDEMDEDYLYKGYPKADLYLNFHEYLAIDKYEVQMLKRQSNEVTAAIDGDGEEDAVEVSIPVDLAQQQEIHKRDFYNL